MIEDKIKSLVDKLKIKKNEVIMLHGDAAVIGQLDIKNINYNLKIFFDQIISKVGKKGAILIPTFTYSFIKKKKFNLEKSKSEVGYLSEVFRNRKDTYRYCHPVFSFSIYGKKIYNKENYKNCFGKKSIFDDFYKNNGRIIVLGNAFEKAATFAHYIEEQNNVKYRYYKKFKGKIIKKNKEFDVDVSYYVRSLKEDTIIKKKKKIYSALSKVKFKRFLIYSIQAKIFFNLCKKEIKINDKFLITHD